jgi:predicted nucleotidyltransferase
MTTIPSREPIVDHLRAVLDEADVRVTRAVLFGSVARGEHDETSDTDVLVVSPDFEGIPGARRGRPLRDRWDYERYGSVDFVEYTPAEYDGRRRRVDGLVRSAEREGIPIASAAAEPG